MDNFDTDSVIAICVLISVLFGLIQFSVWPIKKDIARLENGQEKIQTELKELKSHFDKRMDKILAAPKS